MKVTSLYRLTSISTNRREIRLGGKAPFRFVLTVRGLTRTAPIRP